MSDHPRILVTGASGQLGRLVIDQLLQAVPATPIAAIVRSPASAAALSARGVAAHVADYDQPEALATAFAGIDRLLLISSNMMGVRVAQHARVIDAARAAGVSLLAYTSVLHADDTPISVGDEHRATETLVRDSGIPFVLLRNGWYTENYTGSIPTMLAHHAQIGSAGEGRISAAARADYAAAAVAVLTSTEPYAGRVLELAGDQFFTLAEFVAEVARQSGQPLAYINKTSEEHAAVLRGANLPGWLVELLVSSDVGAARGALFNDSRQLSGLIGRPTTPMSATVAAALA